MPRTTVDLDASVLREVRAIARRRGVSMATVISELLAKGLAGKKKEPSIAFSWTSQQMRARVDLEDRDAVYSAMDRP